MGGGAPPSSSDVGQDRTGGRAEQSAETDGASNTFPPPAVGLPPPFAAQRPAEPPEEYIDPISQEVMLDPVLLVETGQSYERSTLAEWFQQCTHTGRPLTDPLTGQVLKSTTVVSNYSLKSLIATWAERQRISDLHSFAKEVGRQRSMAQGPTAAAAQALGTLRISGGGDGGGRGGGSPTGGGWGEEGIGGSGAGYPTTVYGAGPGGGSGGGASGRPQTQQSAQPPAGPSQPQPSAAAQQALSTDFTAAQPGMYPTGQQPMNVGKRRQAEVALAALRSAATNQDSASRGAAPYNAWTLQQLAGDAEGRELLWEGNAIPLAIYLLGQLQKEPEEAALAAAAPALCGVLQRLGARDAEAAASICQCGGVHALVFQLTAAQPELRAAACRALYFVGWQGADIRSAIIEGLAQHAAACKLPSRPLLAFWRFWEQPAGANGTTTSSSSSSPAAAAGREAEREALALLLHMLAEGCSGAARGSVDSAAAAAALEPLEAASTAVPAVLAHAAAAGGEAAVRFAAHEAAVLLCLLPQNRALLLSALLEQGQEAGGSSSASGAGSTASSPVAGSGPGSAAAGNTAWLLWVLCFRAERGESRPSSVHAAAQQGTQLLALLEAALDSSQGAGAASRFYASGLLTCLLYEPTVRGDGSAAAAADAVRRLLASVPAAGVLQGVLAALEPAVAAAQPQAARAAALAVANLAAYRGGAAAPTSPLAGGGGGGSGDVGKWLSSRIGGAMKHMQQQAAQQAAQEYQQYGQAGQGQEEGQLHSPMAQQPTDPRGALLHHGAVPLLLSLVVSSSAAVAACTATARAPASTALTPDSRQAAAAAAAAAAEDAGLQRAVLGAALLALNNLCADPAAAGALRAAAKASSALHQQLQPALNAALGDRALPETSRGYARLLLHTLSGAPGQRHQAVCTALPPPRPTPAYPNP